MALPSSGQVSFNDIRVELGVPSQEPVSIDAAENGTYATINQCSAQKPSATNPASVQEWWGYDHTATASIFLTNTEGSSATSAEACALAAANAWTLYVAGTVYYRNSSCTTLLNDYYRDETATNWYQFFGGALISQGTCTTTTTTTTSTTLVCACNAKTNLCTSGCSNAGTDCAGNPGICV